MAMKRPEDDGLPRDDLPPKKVVRIRPPTTKDGSEAEWPQSIEAEVALLGSMLIDPDVLETCADIYPKHFYRHAHELIWEAARSVKRRGDVADLVTVCDELRVLGKLEDIGGVSYVSALPNHVPHSGNVRSYARILKRTAIQRSALEHVQGFTEAAFIGTEDELLAGWDLFRREFTDELAENGQASLFTLMTDIEAEALKPSKGILGDILFEDTVAALYGPPGRWKTMIALSWALCIASDRKWLGRDVMHGDVVYVAAEGVRGLGKRIRAWKRHHNVTGATRLHVIGVPVQLLQPQNVQQLVMAIREKGLSPLLIVIDTLARSMAGGDENSTKDANTATDSAYTLKAAFGCCVLLVHHSGKDATKGMRGNSAFLGNADTVIRVTGGEDKARIEPGETVTLTSEKPKDAEPFQDIHLTTVKQQWASDDGEFVSSLVIVPGEAPERSAPEPKRLAKLEPHHRAILDAIADGESVAWGDLKRRARIDDKNLFNRALGELVRTGKLSKEGETPNTRYRFCDT